MVWVGARSVWKVVHFHFDTENKEKLRLFLRGFSIFHFVLVGENVRSSAEGLQCELAVVLQAGRSLLGVGHGVRGKQCLLVLILQGGVAMETASS